MVEKKNDKGSTRITIKGNVNAGRDVVMGDQYNQIVQNVEQNPTPSEYVSALQKVQQELAAMKQQSGLTAAQVRTIDAVESQVVIAAEIANQPEPPVDEIKAALTDAKETMDLLKDSLVSAVSLGALLGNLALMASRVFGAF
jgi:hypothetical protein